MFFVLFTSCFDCTVPNNRLDRFLLRISLELNCCLVVYSKRIHLRLDVLLPSFVVSLKCVVFFFLFLPSKEVILSLKELVVHLTQAVALHQLYQLPDVSRK